MKETLSWQDEVALKTQEVDGAVEADTAVKDDAAAEPEEVRIKEQLSDKVIRMELQAKVFPKYAKKALDGKQHV